MWPFKKGKRQQEEFNITKLRQRFLQRTLKFTEKVVVWVTLLYVINWFVSVILILLAIKETMNFMYLDTLITETSETFRNVVGLAIIKFGVENIFKYNDFGGHVPSRTTENTEDTIQTNDEELVNNIMNQNVEDINDEGGAEG